MPSSRHCRSRACRTAIVLSLALLAARVASAQYASGPQLQYLPPMAKKQLPVENATLDLVGHVMLDASPSAQAGVDDNRAYIPLRGGRLVAVDLATGAVAWSLDIETTLPPTIGDGLVFVAGDELLSALRPDGSVRWSLPMTGGFSAPLLWDTGWLLVAANSGDLLCLRAVDGHVLWTKSLGSPVRARPAIGGDQVYVSLDDGRVMALGLKDGASIWQEQLGGTPGPVFPLDDRVFVGSRDKYFYCLRTKDGKRRWKWRTGGTIVGTAVVDTQRVYFTSFDNVLRALDRNNGSQKWMAGLPLRPTSGPLLFGTVIYVGGVAAELRAYTTHDGVASGQFEIPADAAHPEQPVLAAPAQLVPGPLPELNRILLMTRGGEMLLLRRQLEPAVVPLALPIGVEAPVVPPPVAVQSADAPFWEPSASPLYEMPGVPTSEPPLPPPDAP